MKTVKENFNDIMIQNAGITPVWSEMPEDYSDYPTYVDSDGDKRPTAAYLQSLADKVYNLKRDTVDHIIVWVHEDNWKSDPPGPNNGIWGTNYSFIYGNYQIHYCRWDRDNIVNSLGTLWHEVTHSFDAFIKTYINFDIVTLFPGMRNWDKDMTHGGCCGHTYIGRKNGRENTDALKKIAPYLQRAYTERHKIADEEIRVFISLLKKLVILYRSLLNMKNGVSKQAASHTIMSPKYTLTKSNILPILKVFAWSTASALVVTAIAIVEQTDFGSWAMLVPVINTGLYALKEFITDKQ